MSDARGEILARIAAARASAAPNPVRTIPRDYRHAGTRPRAEVIARFCERVSDYRAEVRQLATTTVTEAVAAACEQHGARRLVIPDGLPESWRPDGVALVPDAEFDPVALDGFDGALTGCTVAIAETGTIALTGSDREGRRAVTLVPDLHICVVEQRQIVELVPEAIGVLGELVGSEARPVTLVSGPSATSDIELSRVEGVHGPRTLVVLVTDQTP
jgi:L-lactate dehydrogenase complex protein LldG